MAHRLVTLVLLGLPLLVGCSGKPTVQQDITLAGTSAQNPVEVTPTNAAPRVPQVKADQTSVSVIVSGSGAATNIVSDPSFDSGNSIPSATQGVLPSPVAIPSPVQSPTRLATAVMIDSPPASENSNAREASPSAVQVSGSSTSVNSSNAANADKKIASKVLTLKKNQPGCKGSECPTLSFKRLTFTGYERFNSFLEQTLLSLALVETNRDQTFSDLNELELYYFKTAKPRDEIALSASVKYMSQEVVVIQLDSYIFSGGPHGTSTTQYLNWLPKTDKLLTLEAMLLPGKLPAFEEALKKQHALWLRKNPLAKEDLASYNKMWPFEPSDNVALLENGAAVTYDPYRLAPYSFGKPTIYIPYRELNGILRPELLPKS